MKKCWCGCEIFLDYSKDYKRCSNCATLVAKKDISYDADHVLDDKDFYGRDYWEKKMVEAANKSSLEEVITLYLKERALYWLKNFMQYQLPGSGTVAEVGCGLGQFSYLMKQCGYDQTAFELSPYICDYIRSTLNINIRCGGLKKSLKPYTAIVAFDVLEHFTDPNEEIEVAKELLTEDGILFFQTPVYDSKLTYQEMLEKRPRFFEQLRENEHVYLYSKESICEFLKRHGFAYVEFMDAFFGNDYDMFFAASRKPLRRYTQKEIDRALEQQTAGWLVKAMLELSEEHEVQQQELLSLRLQGKSHIEQISQLTALLKDSQSAYATLSEDHEKRQVLIESLSAKLNEIEQDRAERLVVIEKLTKQLEESEADRANRLEQILTLTKMIREKESQA